MESPEFSLNDSIGEFVEPKIQLEILVASTKPEENVSQIVNNNRFLSDNVLNYFKMEKSKDEDIVQNGDQNVLKPESDDKVDVRREVTEEHPETDLNIRNIGEDIGDVQVDGSEEEESQATETEPTTQPMTNRSEDDDKREEVHSVSVYLFIFPNEPIFSRMTPRVC